MVTLIFRVTLKVMAKEFLKRRAPNHPHMLPIWIFFFKKKRQMPGRSKAVYIQRELQLCDGQQMMGYVLSEEVEFIYGVCMKA